MYSLYNPSSTLVYIILALRKLSDSSVKINNSIYSSSFFKEVFYFRFITSDICILAPIQILFFFLML